MQLTFKDLEDAENNCGPHCEEDGDHEIFTRNLLNSLQFDLEGRQDRNEFNLMRQRLMEWYHSTLKINYSSVGLDQDKTNEVTSEDNYMGVDVLQHTSCLDMDNSLLNDVDNSCLQQHQTSFDQMTVYNDNLDYGANCNMDMSILHEKDCNQHNKTISKISGFDSADSSMLCINEKENIPPCTNNHHLSNRGVSLERKDGLQVSARSKKRVKLKKFQSLEFGQF